jgi:O-antigen/teichoic acid export membrane protein
MTPEKTTGAVEEATTGLMTENRLMNKTTTSDRVSESMGILARGAAVNMAGSGSNMVGRLIFNLLVARLLGAGQLGVYFLALSIANVVAVVAVGGFDITLVRNLAHQRTQENWGHFRGTLQFAMRSVAVLGVLGTIILLVWAPWISNTLFHKPEVATPLRIVSLYIPFYTFEMILLAATQSFKEMKYKAYIESMLNPAVRIVLVGMIFLLGGGLKSLLITYVGTVALCAILAYFALRRCLPVNLADFKPVIDRRGLLQYSSPLFGVNILTFLIFYADALVLAHFRSSAEVGLYAVCIRLIVITGFALPVVSQIFAPMISELHHRGATAEMEAYFRVVTVWALEFFVPLMLLFIVAPSAILGLFGREFRAAAPCLLILAIGQLVNIITGPVGLILNMSGWTRLQFWNAAVVLTTQTALAFLLVPRYGYMGAAVANTSALVIVNAARIVQLQRRLHINPFSWSLGKPVVASAVALAVGLMFKSVAGTGLLRLVLLWVAMVLAYAATLWSFGLDHHSRLAWNHLRESLGRRLKPGPFSVPVGKEAQ